MDFRGLSAICFKLYSKLNADLPFHFLRYVGPAKKISMETAARIDRRGASATAAAVKAAAEGRRGRVWRAGSSRVEAAEGEDEGINPDDFEPLLYAQLALTSPAVEPDDCRCSEIQRNYLAVRDVCVFRTDLAFLLVALFVSGGLFCVHKLSTTPPS